VVNGGQSRIFDFSDAETVEDLLNILNAEDTGLSAEINATATGINVRSRTSGSDFQIGENGGQTATQLGIRSYTGATRLDALNYGVGVTAIAGDDYTIDLEELTITTRDGQEFDVDLSTALTPGDVITEILAVVGGNVSITANPGGGYTFVDNTAGTGELAIGQAGDPLSFTGGVAVQVPPVDFAITARDGQHFRISLAGAETVQDVIALINAATGGDVIASLATVGNGIQLTDVTGGAGPLSVTNYEGSRAANELGLIPQGSATATTSTATLVGADRHYLDAASVFTTLIRLRDALNSGDVTAIERAITAIDDDIGRASFAHAEIGARERALDISKRSLEDEDVQLRTALSDEIDVDLIEAISNLTARQISLEASLRAMASVLELSLLNFL
jgi:flagellin-like hook-associated protein FlgL